jgi:polyribonucleotide 5'-hydroxyl-kinase
MIRISISPFTHICLKLLEGTAEIFGTELALERVFKLGASKIAIFTWHGCVIEVHNKFLCHFALTQG